MTLAYRCAAAGQEGLQMENIGKRWLLIVGAVFATILALVLAGRPDAIEGNRSLAAAASPEVNPCWVQIWEDENFQDDNDVIFGPGKWNNMRDLPGANKKDWGDEIDSLKTGPGVQRLTVWEDENFEDNSRSFGPNEIRENLRGAPDLGDTIDSMEIVCSAP
jgi:hypothetical protein